MLVLMMRRDDPADGKIVLRDENDNHICTLTLCEAWRKKSDGEECARIGFEAPASVKILRQVLDERLYPVEAQS